MAQEWDIKARGESCSDCTMQFQDRQQYFSALVYGEEGYVRQDFCGRCWMGGKKDATASYSQWQGIFRPPPPPPVEALKKETAESLLRRLIEQDDVTKVNVMYILAIMLERKRILVEKDIQKREDGTKVIVYEHKKTGEVFLIPDPGLQLDQLEHVQIEVVDMLGRHDAAQIPGTETVDPAAPAVVPAVDGQTAPAVPESTEKTEVTEPAATAAGETPVVQEQPKTEITEATEIAEQVVTEESGIVPAPEEEAKPQKASRGRRKKADKPEETEVPAKTEEAEPVKPEPKPAKPGKRGKAEKKAVEAAPVDVVVPEPVVEQQEEKKPEKAGKQKKSAKVAVNKEEKPEQAKASAAKGSRKKA